jgi:GDPmannose 4,6-dehydratase
MWKMTQVEEASDYVIATSQTRSVRDFVIAALSAAGLEPDVERYVSYDMAMKRPSEVDLLVGDASKAKRVLGWEPKTTFEDLVTLMVENDLMLEKKNLQN